MAEKCDVCKEKISTTFLNKIIGTTMKNSEGKKKTICSQCQKAYTDKELKEKISS